MKRKPAVPLRILATLLLVVLFGASCSKDSPIAPSRTIKSVTGAPAMGPPIVSTSEGIVALQSGVSKSSFFAAHNLIEVSDLDIPAAGPYPQTTYYLVRTGDGSDFGLGFTESEVSFQAPHLSVWAPEEDPDEPVGSERDGLSWDDNDTWRNATQYATQPAIYQTGILGARMLQAEGYGSVVAILDTGVDAAHPLFPFKTFTSGGNYTVFPPTSGMAEPARDGIDGDRDGNVDEGVGHGTHVAGIVYTAARQAKLRVYKVLDDEGRGSSFGLAKAIKAATVAQVSVINLSLGLHDDIQMLHHVIAYAAGQGVAVVASAGNHRTDVPQYPASYPEVVSVSAVDESDIKADFANYGTTVDITAPGTRIVSALASAWGTSSRYVMADGTSTAAPFVSAAIAVIRSEHSLTSTEAAAHVIATADDISALNPTYPGIGKRVDIYNSVESVPIGGDPQQ